jgi:hypothetical protein
MLITTALLSAWPRNWLVTRNVTTRQRCGGLSVIQDARADFPDQGSDCHQA